MKSKDEIFRRLDKLRSRYLRQHCASLRGKWPENCIFNHEHSPSPRKASLPTELEISPRTVTSLVVIQQDQKIRLCMYGAEDPAEWPGNVCDSVETARGCKFFQPRTTESEAVKEFENLMADDAWVYEHHKDIAALQWVLDERVHRIGLSAWDRFLLWFDSLMRRLFKPKMLPEKTDQNIPGDLWSDADAEDSGK